VTLGNSSPVSSNQGDVHRELVSRVRRHARTLYRRPIASHSKICFDQCAARIDAHGGPIILDSGCGTGESTRILAHTFPSRIVIGLDKSRVRLSQPLGQKLPKNLCLVRANCVDFWRLASAANWSIERHYLLYPHPWPKAKHLQRRWHGHPVFSSLVALGGCLELRSNWEIYVREFALALQTLGFASCGPSRYVPDDPVSPFERKYDASEHRIYRLTSRLANA
jgi:tRNA (guanine-N7-)-methyltransferase